MIISLSLSPEAEARYRRKAEAAGEDVATYVQRLLERLAKNPPSLRELSGPLADEVRDSQISDEALGELLDKTKKEVRKNRRRKPHS